MDNEKIIIVDENDESVGSMEKMAVHREGILHRAFSILLFDGEGRMLIQRRSERKYHSPLLWANACCSHQREGETLEESAHRRLREELGIDGVILKEAFVFQYRCAMGGSLTENEIDHVFTGQTQDQDVHFNPDEIEQVKWIGLDDLRQSVPKDEGYTCWFRLIVEKMGAHIRL